MQLRSFGGTNRQVAAIGQGTWYQRDDERAAAIAALRRGIDLGMTHIDTAEMYLNGAAEEWIAEAIAARRGEIFLVSKVLPSNASRRGTVAACERSLARLRTDYLDCYLLHWRGSYPLVETVAGFAQLEREGKIRSWGVSNFDARDLDELLAAAGGSAPACNQVLYHLQERAIEHSVLPWCGRHETALVAYSPFGHDRFPGPRAAGGRVLQEVADAHDATPRQVALRFLLREENVFVIPKSSNPAHVEEIAAAGGLALSGAEQDRIAHAFPLGPEPRELPML